MEQKGDPLKEKKVPEKTGSRQVVRRRKPKEEAEELATTFLNLFPDACPLTEQQAAAWFFQKLGTKANADLALTFIGKKTSHLDKPFFALGKKNVSINVC
jgi:hypothetical protein